MRIWITGIAGFLGSHLAETLLSQGHEVWGNDSLVCGSRDNVPKEAHVLIQAQGLARMDCRDIGPLMHEMKHVKPDVVVHCAATAAEGFSVFSPHFITSNIADASVSTFSAAIAAGAKRIVYMSSMSRYGLGGGLNPPFVENIHYPFPIDPYAHAKVYSENVLKTLCETHGVNWSILVPHNIIGTRQEITPYRNVVSIFLNRLKLGLPVYIYGDGEQKRSFSPVKDCLHSLVKVIEGAADGEIVNIGPDGNEITINQLLSICEQVTGTTAERVFLPPRPVTDTVKEAYCSSDKARRLLGYAPQQDMIECIREMSDAMVPKPFSYDFPLEIDSPLCPRTWKEQL
jgi:UDP-glucose 4-epimerase